VQERQPPGLGSFAPGFVYLAAEADAVRLGSHRSVARAIKFVVWRFGPFLRDLAAQRGLVLSAVLALLWSPERAAPWGST
jgi:hypothetical protein